MSFSKLHLPGGHLGGFFQNHLLLLLPAISRKPQPFSWKIGPLETLLFAVEFCCLSRPRLGTVSLLPVFVSQVYCRACLLTYCLWLLSGYNGMLGSCDRLYGPQSPEYSLLRKSVPTLALD